MLPEVSQVTIFQASSNPREYWMIYRGPGFLAEPYNYNSATRPSHPLPPPFSLEQVVPLPEFSCGCAVELTDLRGVARSQIIRPREILALYKSFNTLCLTLYIQWGILGMGFTKCEYCFLHSKISLNKMEDGSAKDPLLMHTLCLQIANNLIGPSAVLYFLEDLVMVWNCFSVIIGRSQPFSNRTGDLRQRCSFSWTT